MSKLIYCFQVVSIANLARYNHLIFVLQMLSFFFCLFVFCNSKMHMLKFDRKPEVNHLVSKEKRKKQKKNDILFFRGLVFNYCRIAFLIFLLNWDPAAVVSYSLFHRFIPIDNERPDQSGKCNNWGKHQKHADYN